MQILKGFSLFCFLFMVELSIIQCQTDLEQQCQAMNAMVGKSTIYYRGSCIVRRHMHVTYDQAKMKCDDFDKVKYRSHLVHLLDKEIIERVREGFGLTVGNVEYIGLIQKQPAIEPAGSWFWVDGDGEPMWSADGHITGLWVPGQPDNNGAEEDCGFIYYYACEV